MPASLFIPEGSLGIPPGGSVTSAMVKSRTDIV